MESTHVISITNGEDNSNSGHTKKEKPLQFPLPTHCSFLPISITSYIRDNKRMKSDHDTKKIIHSIKVGISLVLVSLLYILNPLFEQVGENAMWAIMTVIVIFEFSAGTFTNTIPFRFLIFSKYIVRKKKHIVINKCLWNNDESDVLCSIWSTCTGATLGKGFNRGIGTIVGGGMGCLAAVFARSIGGVGNSIFIGTSVFIFGKFLINLLQFECEKDKTQV